MRSMIKRLAAIALLLGTFSQHTAALAEAPQKILSVSASFSSTDPSGLIITDVSVFAHEPVSVGKPGQGSPESTVHLLIVQRDAQTGTVLMRVNTTFIGLAEQDLQISANLQSATLNTTINVFDSVSGTSFDASINLTWTATGTRVVDNFNFRDITPGPSCNEIENALTASRYAEASGTISFGGTVFNLGPSSDPQTAIFLSSGSGTKIVGCHF
jgi:hypothetical protein